MEGGCSAPVAAHAEVIECNHEKVSKGKDKEDDNSQLEITAGVWSLDGRTSLKKSNKVDYYNPLPPTDQSDAKT